MAKGYNRPPGGGGKMGKMGQIQRLQEQLQAAQERLAEQTVTASVGGGAIKITMSGDQVCKVVEIDPELLKDADAEMLQDLVLSAVNSALDQSRDLASQSLGPLAGGLPF
jgi:DNA-binding YbaB/EbfC family protein